MCIKIERSKGKVGSIDCFDSINIGLFNKLID